MPSITPNLRLSITSQETNKPFLNWRLGIDGPDDSNMIKLDKAWGDMKMMVDGAMAAAGHPYTAATAAEMTDHDKTYVYVGSETGYTNGNWYYWNEDQSAWVSGGVYNATALQTDDTLTLEGEAADAKATGDAVGGLMTQIDEAVTATEIWENVSLTVETTGSYRTDGSFVSADTKRRHATVTPVTPGEKYRLSTVLSSTLIPAILFYNDSEFISYLETGPGGSYRYLTDYEFTIPANCNILIVQNATEMQGEFKLERYNSVSYEFNAYTKAESDNKYAEKTSVYTKAQVDDQFYSQADAEDLENAVNGIENDIYTLVTSWDNITLTVQTGGYYSTNGTFYEVTGRRYAIVTPVAPGDKYRLSTVLSSTLIPAVVFFNDTTFKSYLKTGTGTEEIVTNYEFTIPDDVNKVIVQNSTTATGEFKLEKLETENVLDVYTKSEVDSKIDNKKYGVKWSVSDVNDLGQRCFDAVGLTASIGVGTTNGSSDFDNIYPWSEIKRCNIKKNANGASVVTWENETGFATDGTNGDVFVYIPRFNYSRYQSGGYEYHVISNPGSADRPHPAFVDGDKVLPGIFVGAVEGSVSESKLQSIYGVIPGNNITPSDFLTYAKANGDNYTLYGIKEVSAVWVLMAVEFGCRNSNQVFGYGLANFEQPSQLVERDRIVSAASNTNTVRTIKWSTEHKGYMPVGSNITICGNNNQQTILTQAKLTACADDGDYTDWTFDGDPITVDTDCFIGTAPFDTGFCESVPSGALSWHTGRANWISGDTRRNPMRYRWIENIVGNVWHYLPDITFYNCQMYICDSIDNYGFGKHDNGYYPKSAVFTEQTSNGSKSDTANINYWVSTLNIDPLENDIIIGRTWDTSLTSAKAFGAYYYMKTGTMVVCNGGGFDHDYRCNILTNRAWDGLSIKWYLYGARLIYKNIH